VRDGASFVKRLPCAADLKERVYYTVFAIIARVGIIIPVRTARSCRVLSPRPRAPPQYIVVAATIPKARVLATIMAVTLTASCCLLVTLRSERPEDATAHRGRAYVAQAISTGVSNPTDVTSDQHDAMGSHLLWLGADAFPRAGPVLTAACLANAHGVVAAALVVEFVGPFASFRLQKHRMPIHIGHFSERRGLLVRARASRCSAMPAFSFETSCSGRVTLCVAYTARPP
jgi:hypothetical protein